MPNLHFIQSSIEIIKRIESQIDKHLYLKANQGYQVGDTITLHDHCPLVTPYSPHQTHVTIIGFIQGEIYGLVSGACVLSVNLISHG